MSGCSSRSSSKCLVWCALLLSAAFPFGNANAVNFHVLHRFKGYMHNDGAHPWGGLIEDKNGNLFGTTTDDGKGQGAGGTVFRVAPDGTETISYTFSGRDYPNGTGPMGILLADKSGNLFGTTYEGGSSYQGVVYKLAPDGTESVLHSFGNGTDGSRPQAGLVADVEGNLYGDTPYGGGTTGCFGDGCGTAFKLAPDGTETILHAFAGGSDGAEPNGSLIMEAAGNLYGATSQGGGTACGGSGCGTIFRLAPDGTETILYTFTGAQDGSDPAGPLVLDERGNLYGTTSSTAFKLTPGGTLKVLHTFEYGHDGGQPAGGLVRDGAGNLYGTTLFGGGGSTGCGNGCGTIFELTPKGTEIILHAFKGLKGGWEPVVGVTLDRKGRIFGTTLRGGTCGYRCLGGGTVFEFETR